MQLNRAVNPSKIKSVQRGVFSLGTGVVSVTSAVSAVDMSKCAPLAFSYDFQGTTLQESFIKGKVNSSTQLIFTRAIGAGSVVNGVWELVEYV